MKRISVVLVVLLAVLCGYQIAMTQVVIERRQMDSSGFPIGPGFGTALPTIANDGRPPVDGELFVVRSTGNDPLVRVFNDGTSTWDTTPMLENNNSWTGTNVIGNNDADDITLNGPVQYNVFREDFDNTNFLAFENDSTPAVVTDGSINALYLLGSGNIGIIGYRLEAPGGPGLADVIDPGLTQGVFTANGFVDDVDNEGVQFTLGGHDNATTAQGAGISFNETSSTSMYCEVRADIANISAVDDLWFGWTTNDATDNPPASADFDTAALWTLSDTLGDIDASTMLNNGAETQDDAGTDWTDGDQFTLRVTMLADTVVFAGCFTDACTAVATVTTATAILNADDGDVLKCVLGFTNAAAESLGLTLDHVEIGVSQ